MQEIAERIRSASTPLVIRAGGSKDGYGQDLIGEVLDVSAHTGIVSYEPGELVLTARCGTPLPEIETVLDQHGQMLGFEPPRLHIPPSLRHEVGDDAVVAGLSASRQPSLGGVLACGFSGPRRPYAGSVRDFVLGMEILDGTAQHLKFGGQVIKNVAGYDASRLMVGAMGTLGVILQASLKVLPKPHAERTLQFEMDEATAIRRMNEWGGQALPLSATHWLSDVLSVRLSGAETAVRAAQIRLGGEQHASSEAFWRAVRDHTAAFFSSPSPLWRLAVLSTMPPIDLPGKQLISWSGAERWFKTDEDAVKIRAKVAPHGGHATLFAAGDKHRGVFHPLPEALMKYHRRLKQQFDPRGILNRHRMYSGL
jgi:glycolate oxidase FAD binding subunit